MGKPECARCVRQREYNDRRRLPGGQSRAWQRRAVAWGVGDGKGRVGEPVGAVGGVGVAVERGEGCKRQSGSLEKGGMAGWEGGGGGGDGVFG